MVETNRVHLFTLDSHDYFGPFESEEAAHNWAKRTSKMSYTLTTRTAAGSPVHKPY